jgi:N-acetyl-anhydromuramyl-L-alanine amidase AmpD
MRNGIVVFFCLFAAARGDEPRPRIGEQVARRGDEIMVCGQLYHTTTRVVLWTDPGGYDAYRVEPRFAALEVATAKASAKTVTRRPQRYGLRQNGLSPAEIERVRGGGWDLPLLARVVDQFVIHFDARGTSRGCFEILQDHRGLSVHFLLDLDGTIYQTLDVKEAAWHATIANGRSIGIEVANIGAYPVDGPDPLARWYQSGPEGRIRVADPEKAKAEGPKAGPRSLRPLRDQPVVGTIQGQKLKQFDYTPEQYDALARLTATLCKLFPKIRCDYPRDAAGALLTHKLPDAEYGRYQGILGHYHVQSNKVDPGPAFQWDRLIESTKQLLARSTCRSVKGAYHAHASRLPITCLPSRP